MPINSQPRYIPLLSFANAILLPGNTVSVQLDGCQGFTLVGEVTKNGGHVGVIQSLESLKEADFFSTGTLARLTISDMTNDRITIDLLGVARFDILEFIKTPYHFYGANVSYDRYVSNPTNKKMDRDSLLSTFQKLLSYMDCPDFDFELLKACSNETLLKELMEICPLGHIEKQHILETGALEDQSTLLRQYMEETMLSPLTELTRH